MTDLDISTKQKIARLLQAYLLEQDDMENALHSLTELTIDTLCEVGALQLMASSALKKRSPTWTPISPKKPAPLRVIQPTNSPTPPQAP